MASDFDEKAALKLCRNKGTPADALKTLVGKSVEVDRLIAQHPKADSAVLGGLSVSSDKTTIEYLLLNPNTSKKTILEIISMCPDDCGKLLRDYFKNPDHEPLAIRLAKNKGTNKNLLEVLLGHCASVDRLVAIHPNADKGLLEKLTGRKEEGISGSKDRITRRNAFLNPNVSIYTVLDLAPKFPNEFIKHPLLDEIVTGSGWSGPGLVYRIGQPLLIKILSSRNCPQILLNWACKHGGPLEQLTVWQNPNTPVELLTEMMATGYAQEANVLLVHPDKLIEFAGDLGIVDYDSSEIGSCRKLTQSGLLDGFGEKILALYEKLFPQEGGATIQGEMLCAMEDIVRDYYRNGLGNWHPRNYKSSLFLATHLIDESTFKPFTLSVLRADIRALNAYGNRVMAEGGPYKSFRFSLYETTGIEEAIERLNAAIVVWFKRHPELIPYEPGK